jgi:hypothetical protein
VNSVNLSEFKATLAHEFGHFSQGSLALGRYVYVVNQVVRDIVYGRDVWDDIIKWWCRIDIRLSFPAWGLKGIVWALRGVLDKVYRGITLMDLALSRQMEFNADDVAVSVAGSDAIVHTLSRLQFAGEALDAAAHDLRHASDHDVYTRDLFYHQTASATWLRQQRKDPRLGMPPEPPSDPALPHRVFDPARGDEGIPVMWRTHPANHEREANAKRHYLRVPLDERSPWLLFNDPDSLKLDVTRRFYTLGLERKHPFEPRAPEEVQKFIDAEHAETTYDPKYHGYYDDRFLTPGDLPAVVPQVEDEEMPEARVTEVLRNWPGADLEERMKQHQERRSEMQLLSGLKSGEYTLKGKSFTLRGREHTARDVNMLHDTVEKELADDRQAFADLDRACFKAHLNAARLLAARGQAPAEWADELLRRYRFHLDTQDLLRTLLNDDYRMNSLLRYLQGKSELQTQEFQELVQALREISRSLADCVDKASGLSAPALSNVPEGTPLRRLIWERDADLPHLEGTPTTIKFEWIAAYLKKQNAAQDRLRRVHFKSLGNILVLQEKIARAWRESLPPEPAPTPDIPPEMLTLP